MTTDLPHKKFRQTVAAILPTKIYKQPQPDSDIVWRTPNMAQDNQKRKTIILSNSTSKFDEVATTLPATDEKNFLLGSREKAFITAPHVEGILNFKTHKKKKKKRIEMMIMHHQKGIERITIIPWTTIIIILQGNRVRNWKKRGSAMISIKNTLFW